MLAVLTPDRAERLADTGNRELAALQDREVAFRGQVVALVVADSSETARHAAALVRVEYDRQEHDSELRADRDDLYAPEKVNPDFPTDTVEGDVAAAVAAAEVTVERTYTTAMYHNNPMEPHATTARWDQAEGFLTLWDSTQGVHPARTALAAVFGLDEAKVRVICPYVGGGFGSKGEPHVNTVLAAMAARAVPGRPVRLVLTRQQMFALAGYRTPTIQRCVLAADRDGRLTALAVDVVEQTSRIKEFAEQTGVPPDDVRRRQPAHHPPAGRPGRPGAVLDARPGVCPGMFGPEVALDELAERLGLDPIELRVRNEPGTDPDTGKPFSSRNLVGCLREGAARFGWAGRDRAPGVRRSGDWLVGTGVAASTYPVHLMPESTATIRREGDRYVAEIGAADLGTGTWTTLAQIAADALGVPVERVAVRIGDTAYPMATVAGRLLGHGDLGLGRGRGRPRLPGPVRGRAAGAGRGVRLGPAGVRPLGDARLRRPVRRGAGPPGHRRGPGAAPARRVRRGPDRQPAHGPLAVRRRHDHGLSMALHENSVLDPRTGHVVNHDLAGYHIAAHADVTEVEAHWLDEHDPHVNVLGTKGIGEIGIVGTAAAVSNAVWHACGARVRDLPVTLDKVLPALEERPGR